MAQVTQQSSRLGQDRVEAGMPLCSPPRPSLREADGLAATLFSSPCALQSPRPCGNRRLASSLSWGPRAGLPSLQALAGLSAAVTIEGPCPTEPLERVCLLSPLSPLGDRECSAGAGSSLFLTSPKAGGSGLPLPLRPGRGRLLAVAELAGPPEPATVSSAALSSGALSVA